MSDILCFKEVSKNYGNVRAVDNLSFTLKENKLVGLIGANGAGKTTALRLIVRYLRPDKGSITYKGKPLYSYPETSFPISYIPDVPIYFEELSVKEHFALLSAMYGTENKAESLIHKLNLDEHIDKAPGALSKGNLQRLSIGCAMLREYDLLIADEPFGGLDPQQLKIFRDMLLSEKEQGKTIILSTHLLGLMENICDEYIMIDHGKLLGKGTIDDIVKSEGVDSLEDLYIRLSNNETGAVSEGTDI